MARGGITRTEVERARQALLARAENPSIDAIRIALGNTGSRTTIHRHLKALEALEGTRLDDEALLSETLREQVATLARGLRTEAQATIEALEARHAEAFAQRDAEREQLAAALEETRTHAEQLQGALERERTDHQGARETLAEANAQLREQATAQAALVQRLKEKDAVIGSLEDKHRHARESLEHYRASQKTQREQAQREHADQVQHLRGQLREQAQTLAVKQHELTQLNRDNARLVTELSDLQRAHRELKDVHAAGAVARDALAAQQAKLETQLARKDEAHVGLVAAHEAQEKKYDEARQAAADLENQCLKLRTELEVQAGWFERLQQRITP